MDGRASDLPQLTPIENHRHLVFNSSARRGFPRLNPAINFLSVYRYRFRCLDTQTHLISLYSQHRHYDLISDHYGFTRSARQN
jgi:hypothetical protein